MYKLTILFALCTALCAPALHAISFPFGDALAGTDQQVQTIAGVTLTVDAPVQTRTGTGLFVATPQGIVFSNSTDVTVVAVSTFDLSFDTDVYITGYSIGSVIGTGGDFTLSVDGGDPIMLSAIAASNYNLDVPLLVSVGSVVTFAATNFNLADTATLSSITAEQVPEPAQTAFMVGIGTGLFALGFRRYRRNKNC
ncbi:MAG: hypothetical protein Q7Q73_16165 [Verrucomicrobiota bacterium JB024]|nr:hypothetical protein [Verrucomicrobiota bacterium JB024]